jgi:hypothetical protein
VGLKIRGSERVDTTTRLAGPDVVRAVALIGVVGADHVVRLCGARVVARVFVEEGMHGYALAEFDVVRKEGREHILPRERRGGLERQPHGQQSCAAVHHVVEIARIARHAFVRLAQQGGKIAQRDHPGIARPPIKRTRDGAVRSVRGHSEHDELRAHRAIGVAADVQRVRFDLRCMYEQLIEHVSTGHAHLRYEVLQQLRELLALEASMTGVPELLNPRGDLCGASALLHHAPCRLALPSAEARCSAYGHGARHAHQPCRHRRNR